MLSAHVPTAAPIAEHIGGALSGKLATYERLSSNGRNRFAGPSILLKTRRSQAGEAVLIDCSLPSGEFIGRKHVTAAGLFKRNHTLTNSVDDLGIATDHPSLRRGGR